MEGKIADISLADWGRKEIQLAEQEMPGLMACREQFKSVQPLKGAKISGSLHATVQTAVLIETLKELGASLRWCSCNVFSTQDHAAAAVYRDKSCAMFAWKNETLEDYWWCTFQALMWPNGGPDMIIDDGGDASLVVHTGVAAEVEYEKTGTLPDPSAETSADKQILLTMLRKQMEAAIEKEQKPPTYWRNVAQNIIGVSEETTTGINQFYAMMQQKTLLFPVINVNDSVTKSKFDNIYGCRHSLPDALMRATDVMLAGKKVFVCGFGDVGKGCAAAMKACGAKVYVSEIDPICALQACMEGYHVSTLEDEVETTDVFITATGNCDIIMVEHMHKMKNNSIVCNIGHFDNEIDYNGLKAVPGIIHDQIKPQVDRFVFPDTKRGVIVLAEGRLVNLGCATGHPSFVMSCSFTNQVLAQLDLWAQRHKNKYEKKVYVLPKELDEKVAQLHLPSLQAKLTKLSPKQADYINVGQTGPFKRNTYRY